MLRIFFQAKTTRILLAFVTSLLACIWLTYWLFPSQEQIYTPLRERFHRQTFDDSHRAQITLSHKFGNTAYLREEFPKIQQNAGGYGKTGYYVVQNGFVGGTYRKRQNLNTIPEVMHSVSAGTYANNHQHAYMIGFGEGITPQVAAQIFDNVNVTEIDPAILELQAPIAEITKLSNETRKINNISIKTTDGTLDIHSLEDNSQDAIIIASSDYSTPHAAKMWTKQWLNKAKEKLKRGGVLLTVMHDELVSRDAMRTIETTLQHVFKKCAYTPYSAYYVQLSCFDHKRKTHDRPALKNTYDMFAYWPVQPVTTQDIRNISLMSETPFYARAAQSKNPPRKTDQKNDKKISTIWRPYSLKPGRLVFHKSGYYEVVHWLQNGTGALMQGIMARDSISKNELCQRLLHVLDTKTAPNADLMHRFPLCADYQSGHD